MHGRRPGVPQRSLSGKHDEDDAPRMPRGDRGAVRIKTSTTGPCGAGRVRCSCGGSGDEFVVLVVGDDPAVHPEVDTAFARRLVFGCVDAATFRGRALGAHHDLAPVYRAGDEGVEHVVDLHAVPRDEHHPRLLRDARAAARAEDRAPEAPGAPAVVAGVDAPAEVPAEEAEGPPPVRVAVALQHGGAVLHGVAPVIRVDDESVFLGDVVPTPGTRGGGAREVVHLQAQVAGHDAGGDASGESFSRTRKHDDLRT